MNCARMSMKRQWENIGAGAFRMEKPLDAFLTGKENIDRLIRAGYEQAKRRKERKTRNENV